MLELKNISKRYERKNKKPVKALREVSLSFGDTGFNFIVGRSGGGKTTLLNILACIDTPSSGDVVFDGKPFSSFKREDYEGFRNEIVGTVFQEYFLIPYYNVGENVKIALDLKYGQMSEEEKERHVNEYLRKVGLIDEDGETLYGRDIAELSGGQKQRVAIARAMIKKPKLLLCDEPTGALDERTGKEIFGLLQEFSKECLVIVVTHDESFAREYGDRLIRIDAGQISEDILNKTSVREEARELNNLSGKLSFKQCLKMGARALLHKRVLRTISISVVVLALIVAGISIMNFTLNETYAHIRQAYDSDGAYITVDLYERVDEESEETQLNEFYPNETIRQKLEEYGAIPVRKSVIYVMGSLPVTEAEACEKRDKISHWGIKTALNNVVAHSGTLEVSENTGLKPDSRFEDSSLCRLPGSPEEIAVSDIRFELYKACGLRDSNGREHIITKPDDLIGLKVKSMALPSNKDSYEFTICGVFETPDSERIRSHSAREDNYDCESIFETSYGIANYIFVCPNFYELRGYEFYLYKKYNTEINEYEIIQKDTSRFFLSLTHTARQDYNFLKQFSYEKDGHTYGIIIDNYFDDRMSVWTGFVKDYGYTPFIVATVIFAFFAVTVSFGFLLTDINSRKKEFGILLSLGASHSTVRRIFFIECMITALIEFISAYVGMWIVCAIINATAFHTIYFTAGLLPFALIFAGSIVFTGIAAGLALLPLNSVSPKDIVARAA